MDYILEYLFIAELADGSIYTQSPDDKPRFSPWGSSFTDIAKQKIKKFSLVGKGHLFTINLIDGHFESDGTSICPPVPVLLGAELQLIYWRQVTRNMQVKDGKITSPKIKYIIGWQYNLHGKNHKWETGVE